MNNEEAQVEEVETIYVEEIVEIIEEEDGVTDEQIETETKKIESIKKDEKNSLEKDNPNKGKSGEVITTSVTKTSSTKDKLTKATDQLGRISTLVVLVITTFNIVIDAIESFSNSVWWRFGLNLGLLVLINIPLLIVMLVMIIKDAGKTGSKAGKRIVRRVYPAKRPVKTDESLKKEQQKNNDTNLSQESNLQKRNGTSKPFSLKQNQLNNKRIKTSNIEK